MTAVSIHQPNLDAAYRTFVDGLEDGFALIRDGAIVCANAAFARILGIPFTSLNGVTTTAMVVPHRRGEVRAWLEAVLSGAEYQVRGETELRRGDGQSVPTRIGLSRFVGDD